MITNDVANHTPPFYGESSPFDKYLQAASCVNQCYNDFWFLDLESFVRLDGLQNPFEMLTQIFQGGSDSPNKLACLLNLLRIDNFIGCADEILRFIELYKESVKNEVRSKEDRDNLKHFMMNLFIASQRDVFPVDLFIFFYDSRRRMKLNVIEELYSWLIWTDEGELNCVLRDHEERFEKAVLALEKFDTVFCVYFSPMWSFPQNCFTQRPLYRTMLNLVYYPPNGNLISGPLPEDLIPQIPLGFLYFQDLRVLRQFFEQVGVIPDNCIPKAEDGYSDSDSEEDSPPSENSLFLTQCQTVTKEVISSHWPQLLEEPGSECLYCHNGRQVALKIGPKGGVLVNSCNVYLRDFKGLNHWIDHTSETLHFCPQPDDPWLCYFLGLKPSIKTSRTLSRARKLPILFWEDSKPQFGKVLNIDYFCYLKRKWKRLKAPYHLLTGNWGESNLIDIRFWIKYFVGVYCYNYKNTLQKYEQIDEALQRAWPGITIYKVDPFSDLYPYLHRHEGDSAPFILADPTTNRYIFGLKRYRLMLPWSVEEKVNILSQLHEMHDVSTYHYEVNLNVLNLLLNEAEGFVLVHSGPADISLGDVIEAFDRLDSEHSFDELCNAEKIPTGILRRKLLNIVTIIFKEKGFGDLNEETGKAVYREMKIMFTQTFKACQNDPSELHQYLFDVAKHDGYCSIGVRKELRQYYTLKFPQVQQHLQKQSQFKGFLNKIGLSLIEGFESLAINRRAKQQWVHTRNYLHMFISQVAALPLALANFDEKNKDSWTKGESIIGFDYVKDRNEVVDGGNRETWIPEFTRMMLVPRLVTHMITIWDGLTRSSKGDEYLKVLEESLKDLQSVETALLFPPKENRKNGVLLNLEPDPTLREQFPESSESSEVGRLRQEVIVLQLHIREIELEDDFETFQAAGRALIHLERKHQRAENSLADDGEVEMRQQTPQERDYVLRKRDHSLMKDHFSSWCHDMSLLDEKNKRINLLSEVILKKEREKKVDRFVTLGLLSEKDDTYHSLTVKGAISWLVSKGVLEMVVEEQSFVETISSSSSHYAASSSNCVDNQCSLPSTSELVDDENPIANPDVPIHDLLWRMLLESAANISKYD